MDPIINFSAPHTFAQNTPPASNTRNSRTLYGPLKNIVSYKASALSTKINTSFTRLKQKLSSPHIGCGINLCNIQTAITSDWIVSLNADQRFNLAKCLLKSSNGASTISQHISDFEIPMMSSKQRLELAKKIGKKNESLLLMTLFNHFNVSTMEAKDRLVFAKCLADSVKPNKSAAFSHLQNINLNRLNSQITDFSPTSMTTDEQVQFASLCIDHFPAAFSNVIDQIDFNSMAPEDRKTLAIKYMNQVPFNTFKLNFEKFSIPTDLQNVFIKKAIFSQNNFDGAFFHQFNISDLPENERIDIADYAYEKYPSLLAYNFTRFSLPEEKAKTLSQNLYNLFHESNPIKLTQNLNAFGFSNLQQITLAENLLHFSPSMLAYGFDAFNLPIKNREEFAQKLLNAAPKELTRVIHKFKLSQASLSDLAPKIFEKIPETFVQHIVQFNLSENEKKVFSERLLQEKPYLLSARIDQFHFSETNRIAYAKALLAIKPNDIATNIENFKLDNKQWMEILGQAKREGHLSNSNIEYFSRFLMLNSHDANLHELAIMIAEQLTTEHYDVPKIFNTDTIRAAVRHTQPTLVNASQHYPIQEKFESFFKKLNFTDPQSPYYVDIDSTSNECPDSKETFEEKLQKRERLFFNRLKVITDGSSNNTENDVYLAHKRHKPLLQNALAEIGEKLEALSLSEPEFFGPPMAMLIAGFQACETAQAESINAVHQMLIHQQLPTDVSFEEKIKHLINDAKLQAFLKSSQNYGTGVHAISEARRVIDKVIGLPNSIQGFHDRTFHFSREDRIRIVQNFFDTFTKDFLIDFIYKNTETKQDREKALHLVNDRIHQNPSSSNTGKAPSELQENASQPLIKGIDFLQWISSVCIKKDSDTYETLKNEYHVNLGELLDQPYTIGKTAIERALFELGYLRQENNNA